MFFASPQSLHGLTGCHLCGEVPFFPVSTCPNYENQDDLLIYSIPTPSSTLDSPEPLSEPSSAPLSEPPSEPPSEPTRPPVIHVYSRQRQPTSEPSVVPPAAPSSNQSPPLSTDIPDSEVLTCDLSFNSDSDTAGDSIPPDLDVPIALRKASVRVLIRLLLMCLMPSCQQLPDRWLHR